MVQVQLAVTAEHYLNTLTASIEALEQEFLENSEFITTCTVQLEEVNEEFNTAMEAFLEHPSVRQQLERFNSDPRNFIQKLMENLLLIPSHPTRQFNEAVNFVYLSWDKLQEDVNYYLSECKDDSEIVRYRYTFVKRLMRYLINVPANDFDVYKTRYNTITDELYRLRSRNKEIQSGISDLQNVKTEFTKYSTDFNANVIITF
jgi:hypothetical protein